MIKSGFFNSIEGDRTYNAEDISGMYEGMITDGIIQSVGAELKVSPCSPSGMRVSVAPGKAVLAGKWLRNTDDIVLTLEPSETQPRIDLIVAELNYANREFILCVKKGVAAAAPSAPEPEDNSTRKELPLARINIAANTAAVTEENIEDIKELASVNNVIFPSKMSKLYYRYKTSIRHTLSTVEPDDRFDYPIGFDDTPGMTIVYDVDGGGYHETVIDIKFKEEVTVPVYGTWVAMPLPDHLEFPDWANVEIYHLETKESWTDETGTTHNYKKVRTKHDLFISEIASGVGGDTSNHSGGATCGYIKVMSSGSHNKFDRIVASFINNFEKQERIEF